MPETSLRPLRALDLARAIEAGTATPADVIESCADAIAACEAEVGAFTALDVDTARRRAREDAARLVRMPLRGLPFGIKDLFDTFDLPTAYGTPIHADHRPRADAALVAMIRRAGGLVLGKTVTTPLAFLDPAGTRNPHDPDHTPGGSSSGSAAAVAAGMTPLAIGTQTGGSVIRPAAFCGVAALKASFRLLPLVGCKTFAWSLDTAGIFAARVVDVAFAAEAITGRHLRIDRTEPAAPRIGIARTHVWGEANPAMQAAVETAARAAERAGAKVSDLVLPTILEDAFRAHGTIQDYEAYRALATEYDYHRDRLGPLLAALLDKAAAITPEDYDAARRTTKAARRALADAMAEFDALLTPSAPGAAPRGLGSTGSAVFNRLWTLMGTPCVNVPGLVDGAGMPLGMQIVGRFARDRGALEAAAFLENALVVSRTSA